MTEKCPYCGDSAWINETDWVNFECGTYRSRSDDDLTRSDYCKMAESVARMQPVVDALGKHLTDLRTGTIESDEAAPVSWYLVADAYDKYKEAE